MITAASARRWATILARTVLVPATAVAALVSCGEPPLQVVIPAREPGQQMLDLAGVLDDRVGVRLSEIRDADGLDLVALTYETSGANCGEAFRAAREFVRRWQAEIAIVAVAEPGGFVEPAADREACFGVQPLDDFAVPRGVREEIVEQLAPPLTSDNRWADAFTTAADRLAADASPGQ
jgi:hypothetical protein